MTDTTAPTKRSIHNKKALTTGRIRPTGFVLREGSTEPFREIHDLQALIFKPEWATSQLEALPTKAKCITKDNQ
uniref:Uncharacterized protein n=1 Tax=Arundo donax TaxID=35708 RepID=A0A0A9CEN0_ARUDO